MDLDVHEYACADYEVVRRDLLSTMSWQLFLSTMSWQLSNSEMFLNEYGEIVMRCWDDLPNHYQYTQLDEFVIMPNHVHGIIMLNVGAGLKPALVNSDKIYQTPEDRAGLKPAPTLKQHGLFEIIRALKTFSSKQINLIRNNPGVPLWQRNYYEHIIRDEKEFHTIRQYIRYNLLKWDEDEENPNMKGMGRFETRPYIK